MKYVYTATFTPIEDGSGYYCRVPDLPGCITTGHDLQDSITNIVDAAAGWLCVAEDEKLDISAPSPQSDIHCEPGTVLSLIQVDTLKYRAANDKHAVRKNVSIPAWMDRLASDRKINCSQVLQDGLQKIFETA